MLARLGRFCYLRRRLVVAAWSAFFVIGLVGGGQVFGRLTSDPGALSWESVAGFNRIDDASAYGQRIPAIVAGVPLTDPALRRAVDQLRATLTATPEVGRVLDGYSTPQLLLTDGRGMQIVVDLRNNLPDAAADRIAKQIEGELRTIHAAVPAASVVVGGQRLLRAEINQQTQADTRLGEFVALPATLLVMILVFGGFVAAGLPFLGALVSIAGSLLALLGFSYVVPEMDPGVVSVCTVLSLGLSIDYALLMVSRYREERGLGFGAEEAVVRTAASAGRTITFSALTVATSLAGLFLFPVSIFRAIAAAGVSVVVVSVLAALTLTPALLGLFGNRIRVPSEPVSDEGAFRRLARGVQRRPVAVTVVVSVLLLAAAIPFLGVRFLNSRAELLPHSFESRRYVDVLAARSAQKGTDPVLVVAELPAAGLQAYANQLAARPDVLAVTPVEEVGPGVSLLTIVPRGTSEGGPAQDLVRALRADRPPGRSWVSGTAAVLVDFKHAVAVRVPWALGVVVLSTFVLLFLMTGSLLVPLKALVMNVLSLGASFGALVLIFQDGHLSGLLHFDSDGGLETWVPVVVFAFAFGLSMDYEVFLLARIKELYDAGYPNDEAVARGLQRSGRIITLAALLVVIVFAGFAAGKMLSIKELGVALGLAVFVDATLVRSLLVPATMTLLGDLNWWAPKPLRRLHDRIGLREHPPADQRTASDTRGVSTKAAR